MIQINTHSVAVASPIFMPILGCPIYYQIKIEPRSWLPDLASNLTMQVTLHDTEDSFCTVFLCVTVYVCVYSVSLWSMRDRNGWWMPQVVFINSPVQALWHFHVLWLLTRCIWQNLHGQTIPVLWETWLTVVIINTVNLWSEDVSWDPQGGWSPLLSSVYNIMWYLGKEVSGTVCGKTHFSKCNVAGVCTEKLFKNSYNVWW